MKIKVEWVEPHFNIFNLYTDSVHRSHLARILPMNNAYFEAVNDFKLNRKNNFVANIFSGTGKLIGQEYFETAKDAKNWVETTLNIGD